MESKNWSEAAKSVQFQLIFEGRLARERIWGENMLAMVKGRALRRTCTEGIMR